MESQKIRIVKRYVDIIVLFKENGDKVPKVIIWEPGKLFKIERILDVRPAASRKAGGQGERYLCQINGTEHAVFFEDPAWFVEEKIHSV